MDTNANLKGHPREAPLKRVTNMWCVAMWG